jgi:predicted Zn-dependent peptidase
LAQILGRGRSSKLNKTLKEQKGLANTVNAYNYVLKDDGLFIIYLTHSGNNTEKIEEALFNEIKQIQKYGITEEELITAKKMIEQEVFFDRESTSDIAKNIGYIMATTGDYKLYENYIPEINKVTAKNIQNVAQKYLNANKSAISSVLPKNCPDVTEKEITQHSIQEDVLE